MKGLTPLVLACPLLFAGCSGKKFDQGMGQFTDVLCPKCGKKVHIY